MRSLGLRIAIVIAAAALPALGCHGAQKVFTPTSSTPPPPGMIDEPPPLHTGGLSVLNGHPEAPGFHGNPAAAAVATGIGAAAFGAAAVKTIEVCSLPDASVGCLKGPGPSGVESDAGAP